MEKRRAEGVIINAYPFQDYDRILTLFTLEEGLIKLIVKGAFSTKKGKGNTTTPLNQVEAIYCKGRGELYKCYEISILDSHLGLRKNLDILNAACDMLNVIAATQQPEKVSPELYHLFVAYLKRLPTACDPLAISCSFRLKTLVYEGVFGLAAPCSICGKELSDSFLTGHEAYCYEHAPSNALVFAAEEITLIEKLSFSRNFSELAALRVPALLAVKINRLFEESIL